MGLFADQLCREIVLNEVPRRIISLVPSQTELLFHLGLDQQIIGITKFCIHPEQLVKSKTKVGGTKQLNLALIRSLRPDLVIANKEENERSQVEALAKEFPVWISDISNLHQALQMIKSVGEVIGCETASSVLINQISGEFDTMPKSSLTLTVAYFIWRSPYLVAGKNTFIDDMLQRCGLLNAFEAERYPEVSPVQLAELNPEVVLLSSEPYPFKAKHLAELKAILPKATIKLVDGELFSWYGSRLLQAPAYFKQLAASIINTKTSNGF